jgi:hypothetical protein
MLLDVLDDVFLLDLPLEATEGTFDRLALLNLDFGHASIHPLTRPDDSVARTPFLW